MKTFRNDMMFGRKNEKIVYELLKVKFGKDNIVNTSNSYEYYDFKIYDKKYIIELKSRNIKHNQYKTTIIGYDKFLKFNKFQKNNKDYEFIIIYKYIDGIYFIKLNRDILKYCEVKTYKRHSRIDYEDKRKDHIFIPITLLKSINLLN